MLGHPGVPGEPPEYRGFAHFQGVHLAPLGDQKNSLKNSLDMQIGFIKQILKRPPDIPELT